MVIETSAAEAAGVLSAHQPEIIEYWQRRVRKIPRSEKLPESELIDHIPDLVANIIQELQSEEDSSMYTEFSGQPPAHAIHRFKLGFHLREMVAEFNALRCALFTVAERHGLTVAGRAAQIIHNCLDESVARAVDAFVDQRESERAQWHDDQLKFIVHDLRTPLNAVSLSLDELEHEDVDPELTRELFNVLRRNVQRLELLVRAVMERNQSTLPQNEIQPDSQNFELWPLLHGLIDDLRPVTTKAGVTINNHIPKLLTAHADPNFTGQIFQNLIGNVCTHAPRSTIDITAWEEATKIRCSIADNGPGIPRETLSNVFEKSNLDPASNGTGFGLPIIKQLVHAHGGEIQVRSQPGAGTTFFFTLPKAS